MISNLSFDVETGYVSQCHFWIEIVNSRCYLHSVS